MSDGEERRWVVPEEVAPGRADRLLAAAFPEYSRADLQRALGAGLVRRGERELNKSDRLAPGDEVVFRMPETQPATVRAVEIPLAVCYEDEELLVIDKPAGMVVHPGVGTGEDTLVHALLAHCRGQLSGIGGVERPGIVHRLDRETSGLLVVAKTDRAHRALAAGFQERTVYKEYLAAVVGVPRLRSGVIDRPIHRHPVHRHRMAVAEEGGRPAKTDWWLERAVGTRATLLRCRIHTGRTHQIRVHLKWLGHPILGDAVYGGGVGQSLPAPPRLLLHAARLEFAHPVTGAAVALAAPLPEDFAGYLRGLEEA
ncbi:MAG: RluA family pseudouridine synthase [Puniceicoccaceae bacterium]|nr:MAG: RluA family pseudouridine synthase [Puniceicoccaceae bacterium]